MSYMLPWKCPPGGGSVDDPSKSDRGGGMSAMRPVFARAYGEGPPTKFRPLCTAALCSKESKPVLNKPCMLVLVKLDWFLTISKGLSVQCCGYTCGWHVGTCDDRSFMKGGHVWAHPLLPCGMD